MQRGKEEDFLPAGAVFRIHLLGTQFGKCDVIALIQTVFAGGAILPDQIIYFSANGSAPGYS
jgi:hypothetical protein